MIPGLDGATGPDFQADGFNQRPDGGDFQRMA